MPEGPPPQFTSTPLPEDNNPEKGPLTLLSPEEFNDVLSQSNKSIDIYFRSLLLAGDLETLENPVEVFDQTLLASTVMYSRFYDNYKSYLGLGYKSGVLQAKAQELKKLGQELSDQELDELNKLQSDYVACVGKINPLNNDVNEFDLLAKTIFTQIQNPLEEKIRSNGTENEELDMQNISNAYDIYKEKIQVVHMDELTQLEKMQMSLYVDIKSKLGNKGNNVKDKSGIESTFKHELGFDYSSQDHSTFLKEESDPNERRERHNKYSEQWVNHFGNDISKIWFYLGQGRNEFASKEGHDNFAEFFFSESEQIKFNEHILQMKRLAPFLREFAKKLNGSTRICDYQYTPPFESEKLANRENQIQLAQRLGQMLSDDFAGILDEEHHVESSSSASHVFVSEQGRSYLISKITSVLGDFVKMIHESTHGLHVTTAHGQSPDYGILHLSTDKAMPFSEFLTHVAELYVLDSDELRNELPEIASTFESIIEHKMLDVTAWIVRIAYVTEIEQMLYTEDFDGDHEKLVDRMVEVFEEYFPGQDNPRIEAQYMFFISNSVSVQKPFYSRDYSIAIPNAALYFMENRDISLPLASPEIKKAMGKGDALESIHQPFEMMGLEGGYLTKDTTNRLISGMKSFMNKGE